MDTESVWDLANGIFKECATASFPVKDASGYAVGLLFFRILCLKWKHNFSHSGKIFLGLCMCFQCVISSKRHMDLYLGSQENTCGL